MKTTEELIRAFAETDPTPRTVEEGKVAPANIKEQIFQYQRDRLLLEVLLDTRDLLKQALRLSTPELEEF